MLAHRAGPALAQPVVQALVVRVVESLLLECPFEVPVDFGQKAKVRVPFPDPPDRGVPKRRRRYSPRPFKHLRQDKHCHVAAHAVTLAGDLQELTNHGFLRGQVAIVELKGICPARKVRIASMREEPVALGAPGPRIILRRPREVELRPRHVILRVLLYPRMIPGRVIGNEVEHESQVAAPETLAEPGERRVPSEIRMHGIAGNRETGACNILLAQVRQRFLELLSQFAIGARNALSRLAGTPNAQEPDPVEPRLREAVQGGVRNVVQRRCMPEIPAEFRQPDARIDLVERGRTQQTSC